MIIITSIYMLNLGEATISIIGCLVAVIVDIQRQIRPDSKNITLQ